jgi:N-acyl-D-amino-acid deacylase
MHRLAVLLVLSAAAPAVAQERFDVLIRGGRVLDGTGNPWYRADIGIRDGRIVAMGRLQGAGAGLVIDAGDLYVARVSSTCTPRGRGLDREELKVLRPSSSGVTTAAQSRRRAVALSEQRARYEAHDRCECGADGGARHGAPQVMGWRTASNRRRARADEDLVREGMAASVRTFERSLLRARSYAATEEVIALAKEVHRSAFTVISATSDYTVGLLAAVEEWSDFRGSRHSRDRDPFQSTGSGQLGSVGGGLPADRESAGAGSPGVGGSVSL